MAAKTERITILGSPEFKSFLNDQAMEQNISVSELVRRRCEQAVPSKDDEAVFAELVDTLNHAVDEAQESLDRGLAKAGTVLAELKSKREARQRGAAQTVKRGMSA